MVKISVIIPVSTAKWNQETENLLKGSIEQNTKLYVTNIQSGPEAIECAYDESFASPHVIRLAQQLERKSHGILIYCFNNPGLQALKEKLTIPVVGIGEAAYIMSLAIGEKIGVVSPMSCSISQNIQYARMMGLDDRIIDFTALDIPVLSLTPEVIKEKMCQAVDGMIRKNKIDTVILGCGSLFGISEIIEKKYKVPVIVPGKAGITLLESLIKMNVRQSKKIYMTSN